MMDNDLHLLVSQFFNQYPDNHPSVNRSATLSLLNFQESRAERLSQAEPPYIRIHPLNHLPISTFVGQIYEASCSHPGHTDIAILAFYKDGKILWLDDHSNDEDYSEFLQRETIVISDASVIANFVGATKFAYLPRGLKGRVIGNSEDIPRFPEHLRQIYGEQLAKDEQSILEIAAQIHPPILTTEDEATHLNFYYWSQDFGVIYKLLCKFEGSKFDWEGEMIATLIGDAFVQR